jgi:beta-aspartyl-peptidase (threonine type)
MRHHLCLMLGLLVLAGIPACQKGPDRSAGPELPDGDMTRTALLATAGAWNSGDLEGFLAPYDTASTFMTDGGTIGKASLKERYAARYFLGGKPVQRLAYDSLVVRPLGSAHLLMTGRYTLSGGGKPERRGHFTLIWRKTPEGWKILHDHSS